MSASGVRSEGSDCDGCPEGRQQQYRQLSGSLAECSRSGRGRAIYVSGLPGTGGSAGRAGACRGNDWWEYVGHVHLVPSRLHLPVNLPPVDPSHG